MTAAPPTAPPGSAPPRGRPDAVQSLLGSLVGDGLDEGYLLRAREKGAQLPPPPGPAPRPPTPPAGKRIGTAVVACLVLAGLLLATAATQTRRRAPDTAAARDELVREVTTRDQVADRLQADIEQLERDIAAARAAAARADRTGAELSADLEDLGILAGTVAVRGPGIRVVVDDAADTSTGGDDRGGQFAQGRVLDRDLQDVVNALWASGAEAVAIDGIRLTSRSAIRAAGEAVLVDFRPATPPYVIEALGNPQRLPDAFAATSVAQRFELWRTTYGIGFEIRAHENLTLRSAAPPALRAVDTGDRP